MKKETEKNVEATENQVNPNQISLIFIINGEPIEVTANVHAPLKTAVQKALNESGNTGRPIEDWQVKLNGNVLDMNAKIEDLRLTDGTELLLSLKTGQGGEK